MGNVQLVSGCSESMATPVCIPSAPQVIQELTKICFSGFDTYVLPAVTDSAVPAFTCLKKKKKKSRKGVSYFFTIFLLKAWNSCEESSRLSTSAESDHAVLCECSSAASPDWELRKKDDFSVESKEHEFCSHSHWLLFDFKALLTDLKLPPLPQWRSGVSLCDKDSLLACKIL